MLYLRNEASFVLTGMEIFFFKLSKASNPRKCKIVADNFWMGSWETSWKLRQK